MTTISTPPLATESELDMAVPQYPIFRLSVPQYHAMINAGILTEEDPIELLEGWLTTKMPKNPSHRLTTQILRDMLAQILPDGWFVEDQEPVTTENSEPEPDGAVIRGKRRDYLLNHPTPKDVILVIEVAEAALKQDRTIKKRLYASANIPVYWIVNLVENCIEVYSEPLGTGGKATYGQRQVYGVADEVPVVIDGRPIAALPVKEILP